MQEELKKLIEKLKNKLFCLLKGHFWHPLSYGKLCIRCKKVKIDKNFFDEM